MERLIVRQDEEIRELEGKLEGRERLEQYSDSDAEKEDSNREEKRTEKAEPENQEEVRKRQQQKACKELERKEMDNRDGKRKLVIRKGIAWRNRYVETWIKEKTNMDYDNWTLEPLNKKGTYTHNAWVVKTNSKTLEDRLKRTMIERGEKEFTVESFISAKERWEIKEAMKRKGIYKRLGYKGKDIRKNRMEKRGY
ncbi:hypothetical protein QAD02_008538 [Eretmocerus hayati]|uniref:Uncharacterized protein n=1 Tax=Eretmocerus hayati TaxID=131215 RepID=A0ACC2N719_9HYME|nr:hypothetical protein QAD02_008538 [Eretmocerus hayati]